ncbi:mitochondrial import inner membrane translocase subunit tim13 [Drosophila ficusphila]|uniref:mitochondrial import inner membrane translocase subunit tim13 n=1 Tax=Drosophila ficusphila TaxID=30025 RepID=UPI0007E8AC1D|nr:mitochondrial import inner membrane translocase subunit tim13 [Drosophila ficusphila]
MAPNHQLDLERIRQQIVLANIQELLKKMTRRCFNACVALPGCELRSAERDCLSTCMDRFMDSVKVVSCQYFRRRNRQQQLRLSTSPSAFVSATESASASSNESGFASASANESANAPSTESANASSSESPSSSASASSSSSSKEDEGT